jgi:hypothetical protein
MEKLLWLMPIVFLDEYYSCAESEIKRPSFKAISEADP